MDVPVQKPLGRPEHSSVASTAGARATHARRGDLRASLADRARRDDGPPARARGAVVNGSLATRRRHDEAEEVRAGHQRYGFAYIDSVRRSARVRVVWIAQRARAPHAVASAVDATGSADDDRGRTAAKPVPGARRAVARRAVGTRRRASCCCPGPLCLEALARCTRDACAGTKANPSKPRGRARPRARHPGAVVPRRRVAGRPPASTSPRPLGLHLGGGSLLRGAGRVRRARTRTGRGQWVAARRRPGRVSRARRRAATSGGGSPRVVPPRERPRGPIAAPSSGAAPRRIWVIGTRRRQPLHHVPGRRRDEEEEEKEEETRAEVEARRRTNVAGEAEDGVYRLALGRQAVHSADFGTHPTASGFRKDPWSTHRSRARPSRRSLARLAHDIVHLGHRSVPHVTAR